MRLNMRRTAWRPLMKLASRSGSPHKLESETQVFGSTWRMLQQQILGLGCWHGGWRLHRCSTACAKGNRIHGCCTCHRRWFTIPIRAAAVWPTIVMAWRWKGFCSKHCRRSSWRLWHTMEPAKVSRPRTDVRFCQWTHARVLNCTALSAACGSTSVGQRVPFRSKTILVATLLHPARGTVVLCLPVRKHTMVAGQQQFVNSSSKVCLVQYNRKSSQITRNFCRSSYYLSGTRFTLHTHVNIQF
jgi:hypothetical protein